MSSVDSVKKPKSANCLFSGINPLFVISVKISLRIKQIIRNFEASEAALMKSADTEKAVITAVDTVKFVL